MGRMWVVRAHGAMMAVNLGNAVVSGILGTTTYLPCIGLILFSAFMINLEQRRPKIEGDSNA